MISVKDAVASAFASVQQFYEGKNVADLLLEEVELSDDERFWLITVSFKISLTGTEHPLAVAMKGLKNYETKYKIVKVNSETSDVISMKIRPV